MYKGGAVELNQNLIKHEYLVYLSTAVALQKMAHML